MLDADIPVKQRNIMNHVVSKRVDDLVDREVDVAGTPMSLVNKAVNSANGVPKKKRIVVSDDDDDDDVPLVFKLGSHHLIVGSASFDEWNKCGVEFWITANYRVLRNGSHLLLLPQVMMTLP